MAIIEDIYGLKKINLEDFSSYIYFRYFSCIKVLQWHLFKAELTFFKWRMDQMIICNGKGVTNNDNSAKQN